MPVLCNHCSDAPCVKICPGNPEKAGNPTKDPNGKPWKAMYKTPEGITLHDPALCVGCGDCQKACPYSQEKLGPSSLDGGSYSVISLNPADENPQPRWADKTSAIPGCTASGAEIAALAGAMPPMLNAWKGGDLQPVRIGRRGREMHLLLPPRDERPATRLRGRLPGAGPHLR
jgi:ferredoxin